MVKHMRSKLSEEDYTEFQKVQAEIGAKTNGETVAQLVEHRNGIVDVLESEGIEYENIVLGVLQLIQEEEEEE